MKEVGGIETFDADERAFVDALAMGGMKHADIVDALNEPRRRGGAATGGGPLGGDRPPADQRQPEQPGGPPYPGPDVTPMDRQERRLVQDLLKQGKGEEDVRRALAERRAAVKSKPVKEVLTDGRNNGLPEHLFTHERRYRINTQDGDAALHARRARSRTAQGNPRLQVPETDFVAHHLIPMEMVRKYFDLSKAASRAGWHPDEAANLLAMPGGAEQQTCMGRAMGQQRPIHNSGHREWNEEVEEFVKKVMGRLKVNGIEPPYHNTDGQEIRRSLGELQQDLRRELLDPGRPPRLTQRTTGTETA